VSDRFGYKVLRADNADAALAVLKAGVHCDLLFTDVVMPGKTKSMELACTAKVLLPKLKVLYTSGHRPWQNEDNRQQWQI